MHLDFPFSNSLRYLYAMRARIKLRHFPGTIGKTAQVKLVETDKAYKKEHVKLANRRQRHDKSCYRNEQRDI